MLRDAIRLHGLAAGVAALAFLWATVLSASPELHARIHSDASQVQHSCAAIYIGSGQVHHTAPTPLIENARPKTPSPKRLVLVPEYVAPLFLDSAIFEHAPPLFS